MPPSCHYKEQFLGVGETALWLRALVALEEDLGLVMAPTWQLTAIIESVQEIRHHLVVTSGTRHTHNAYSYMQARTHVHKMNNK